MRVTLSPTVRTFGATRPDTPQEPGPGPAPTPNDLPGGCADAALPPSPDGLDEAAPASRDAGGEALDPALQAWLQPLAASAGAPPPDLFGALAMTSGSGATDVFADRDALAGLARAALSAAPPAPPASSSGLRMAIEAIGAGVSDPHGDGRVQLRFDPKFANCDPVIIALDQEQALGLMRRLMAWAEGAGRGADAGLSDASF